MCGQIETSVESRLGLTEAGSIVPSRRWNPLGVVILVSQVFIGELEEGS